MTPQIAPAGRRADRPHHDRPRLDIGSAVGANARRGGRRDDRGRPDAGSCLSRCCPFDSSGTWGGTCAVSRPENRPPGPGPALRGWHPCRILHPNCQKTPPVASFCQNPPQRVPFRPEHRTALISGIRLTLPARSLRDLRSGAVPATRAPSADRRPPDLPRRKPRIPPHARVRNAHIHVAHDTARISHAPGPPHWPANHDMERTLQDESSCMPHPAPIDSSFLVP